MSDGRALVLFSGGLDSSSLAAFLKMEEKKKIYPLFIKRGQRALKWEFEAAKSVADFLEIRGNLCTACYDVSEIRALRNREREKYDPAGYKSHPERNLVLVALGYGFASALNAPEVYVACNHDDHLPDTKKEFFDIVSDALRLLKPRGQIILPFRDLKWGKDQIIRWTNDTLGIKFLKLTRSCWEDNPIHCGVCEACESRKDGFAKASVRDPTEYQA